MKPWKAQKFAGDLVYDLRNRGLLPVAVLLLIAIVAAPMAIKMTGSDAEPAAPVATGNLKSASEIAPEGQAAVLAYSPGLRNYRERLDRGPQDPFVQQFANSSTEKTLEQSTGTTTGDEGTGDGGTPDGGGGGGGGGGNGGGSGKERNFYTYFQVDVLVGLTGAELTRRNDLPEFTVLPAQETPVAVFLGASENGQQAIFSVSRAVTSVGGTGTCYPEPDNCELLGLARAQGADLTYQGTSYHLEVANIKRIKSTKPPD